jgi:murein L,D-transpeptidase YcbB/YkuD
VAETLKETTVKENDQDSEENINTDEETTQPISENEQREKQSLQSRHTVENPELDKIKIEFHKALKEFEGTDPAIRLQIPKQKCSRKLATIITAINQKILPKYMKNKVTNFPELHIIYAAAVATVRMSGGKIKNNPDYSQNKQQTPPWENRLKKQINDLRKDIGTVQQVQRGNTSNRIQKHMRRIWKKKKNTHTCQIQPK